MAKKRRKRASFRAKADRLWSQIVRLPGECAVCGATKYLNAHHLIPRQLVKYRHIPVMIKEVLEYLDPKPGQNFIDCTLGGGGHSKAILESFPPENITHTSIVNYGSK